VTVEWKAVAVMTEPKRILVPVDLTDKSRPCIAYAGMLARGFGSSIVLVTNVNVPELSAVQEYGRANDIDQDDVAGKALLSDLADELAPGVDATIALAFDDFPAEGILAAAGEYEADLIVLASRGRRGVSRFFLGSVAETVARKAHVPVVLVPVHDEHGNPE
jgi:nucleotide-binding universal stress UspA family protein